MEQIQFISTTPQALANLIANAVKIQLEEFKEKLKPDDSIEYLSRQNVAKLLNCSIGTVHNLSVKKVIVKYQIGGKVMYRKDQVEQAIIKLK